MKQFLAFIRKEFAHVFRDPKTLLMLFGVPIAQIVLFGFALTNEIKNAQIVVVDNAHDLASTQIINKLEASGYFTVSKTVMDHNKIEEAFKGGKVKLAVVFPPNFNTDLLHFNAAQVQVIADASDPNTATTLTAYVGIIISDYQAQLWQNTNIPYRITPSVRMLYNPDLKSAPNFVPGVMALVLLLVCVMMTSISIVREKELGTMEILLVSPFKPVYVILAKAIPYLVLSLLNLTIILVLSVFALHLPIEGSLFLLYGVSTIFILACLGLGLLVSTATSSQEGAMTLSLLATMLPTLLLSGYLFPIENMPIALQVLSNIVPAKWFYIIIKSIMLKGLGIKYIWKQTLVLVGMMVFFMVVSLRNFKIRLE